MFSDNENPGVEISAGQSATAAIPAPENTTAAVETEAATSGRGSSARNNDCRLLSRLPRSQPPLRWFPPNLSLNRTAQPPFSIPT